MEYPKKLSEKVYKLPCLICREKNGSTRLEHWFMGLDFDEPGNPETYQYICTDLKGGTLFNYGEENLAWREITNPSEVDDTMVSDARGHMEYYCGRQKQVMKLSVFICKVCLSERPGEARSALQAQEKENLEAFIRCEESYLEDRQRALREIREAVGESRGELARLQNKLQFKG